MELIFPFRNITLNSLLNFYDEDHVRNYIQAIRDQEDFEESQFANEVEFYKNYIPSFENEILQICEVSNQETIDYLFEALKSDIALIKETFTKEELLFRINQWNDNELNRFNESIESKVESFLSHPNRKLKNLEEYEPSAFEYYMLITPIGKPAKTKAVNHNFYCIEDTPKIIDERISDSYPQVVKDLAQIYIDTINRYGLKWQNGEIKSKANTISIKPVIFFEGAIDVDYVKKAAEILNELDLLNSIELKQRGSSSNLDKLWNTLITDNWETFIQKKAMIYDCDTGRPSEDFGHIHRRCLPLIENHPIKRGIENLFPFATIEKGIAHKRAFIDYKLIDGFERGVKYTLEEYTINKEEKRNFCTWLCQHGDADDFKFFEIVFRTIRECI